MTLQELCDKLPKEKQAKLAITFIKMALPIWNQYADQNKLAYRDTVVGLHHDVPKQLLHDTIIEIEKYLSRPKFLRAFKNLNGLRKLYFYFGDPIVALQDCDWELPYKVQTTFYSVYNLLGSIIDNSTTVFGDSTIYVSINQAIDAITTAEILSESQVKQILENTLNTK